MSGERVFAFCGESRSHAMKELLDVQTSAEAWSAEEVLTWAARQFADKTVLASSFGAEDVVLIHMVSLLGAPFLVFTLDTDFLFPETYRLISDIEAKYGITVERVPSSLTPEAQALRFGDELWKREPDRCCGIRKVEPLTERLKSSSAWIT